MMSRIFTLTTACAIAATALIIDPVESYRAEQLTVGTALAYDNDRGQTRRIARRTARRVERRQDRLEQLPAQCESVIVNGARIWHCDSIYYKPVIEAGKTVYVIVTP